MASTIAIATSYNLAPETLESWANGNKPTEGDEAKLYQDIFSKFEYIDGNWQPLAIKPVKKPKTKSASKLKDPISSNPTDFSITSTTKVKQQNSDATVTALDTSSESVTSFATVVAVKATDDVETPKTETDSANQKADDTAATETSEDKEQIYFTAIGIIRGEVTFDESEEKPQHTVKFGGKTYPLFYAKKNMQAFTGLKKEIESTGLRSQRLIVYPKFTHFPKKEEPPRVGFQLVGFDRGLQPEGITSELQDNEFKLCGIWQFIPVCRQPCISIFRNFTKERLDYVKRSEAQQKVNFMKASHLPILWRDGPVKPFRFNPRLEKEQQAKTYFVQIKAKFLPGRDCFGFSSMLGEPIEKPPKFLKASKADKAEVQKKSAKNKPPGKGNIRPSGKPKNPPKKVIKPKAKTESTT